MVESIVPTLEELENWKPFPSFESRTERTFQYQAELPSLPLPELETTMTKYLDSVKPHVTEEEYRKTEEIVWRFSSGPGRLLHMKLEDKANRERNWMDKYWLEEAYLKLRWPLAPFTNTCGPSLTGFAMFQNVTDGMDLTMKRRVQREHAAYSCYTTALFWKLVRDQQFIIGRAVNGDRFCMSQFKQFFSTCRVPGRTVDQLRLHFRSASEGDSPRHVLVICRGRLFSMPLLTAEYELLSPGEIEKQLRSIQDRCFDETTPAPAYAGLGAMTSEYRNKWAEVWERLIALSPNNQRLLEIVETAICVLVLDEAEPETVNDVCKESLCGDAKNRWFDKSVQLIVFRNGHTGVNFEHSPFEGVISTMYGFFTDVEILRSRCHFEGFYQPPTLFAGKLPNVDFTPVGFSASLARAVGTPVELEFVVDSSVQQAVEAALQQFAMHSASVELNVEAYDGYGKKFMRQYGLHPDTVVQCALQLAYYRLHGRPAPTYETASCRRFYRGRTETIRSCTAEVIDWCKSMLNDDVSENERWHLFERAMHKHNALREVCQKNSGCDRHLLGLKCTAAEFGTKAMQELFNDPSWVKSGGDGHFILSTSFFGYLISIGGVVPMCEHGYGTFYGISNEKVRIFMSAWAHEEDTSTRSLMDALKRSLDDIRQLVLQKGRKAPRSLADFSREQQEEIAAILEKQQIQSKI